MTVTEFNAHPLEVTVIKYFTENLKRYDVIGNVRFGPSQPEFSLTLILEKKGPAGLGIGPDRAEVPPVLGPGP